MQKIIAILICLFMIMSMVGCSSEVANKDVETENKDEETNDNEITIIMGVSEDGNKYEDKIYSNHMVAVKREIEKKSDIKVNIERVKTSTYDEYLQKRNMKLYLDDGPTLILIKRGDTTTNLIKQGVALKVDEKVQNYKNIYSSLKDNYFIPVSMHVKALPLKRDVLKSLKIPLPDYNWTVGDFRNIEEKWIEGRDIYFTISQYYSLRKRIDDKNNIKLLDEEKMEFKIASEEVVNHIKEIREEVFSGKYILNEEYTYQNYYNMFFVRDVKEKKEQFDYVRKNAKLDFRADWWHQNYPPLQTLHIKEKYKDDTLILQDPERDLYTWGFIVNKKGKNLDKGLEFLNELLSEDIQFEIFENYKYLYSYYPVIGTIEDRIEEIEKEKEVPEDLINLRKHVLKEIESGEYRRGYKMYKESSEKDIYHNPNIASCFDKYYKLEIEIIFADTPYTDKEIMEKLKKLENELNIMLNE